MRPNAISKKRWGLRSSEVTGVSRYYKERPMIAGKIVIRFALAVALTLSFTPAQAQRPLLDSASHSAAKPAAVAYLYPEQITVPAGKSSIVALHFRIAPGLHINSHTPREVELIPTVFSI